MFGGLSWGVVNLKAVCWGVDDCAGQEGSEAFRWGRELGFGSSWVDGFDGTSFLPLLLLMGFSGTESDYLSGAAGKQSWSGRSNEGPWISFDDGDRSSRW